MSERWRDNVRRGAKLLDRLAPGSWYSPRKIRLTTLDMASSCECVSGQLRDSDPELRERFIETTAVDGYRNGFPRKYGMDGDNYDILQDEWEKQIRARRQADRV